MPQMEEIGVGEIVSGVGRGMALDRDGNFCQNQTRIRRDGVRGREKVCCIIGPKLGYHS